MDARTATLPEQTSDTKEYTSLPLALALSSAVLLGAAGGWFILGPSAPESIDESDSAIVLALATEMPTTEAAAIDIDSELRKARLAADADILLFPPEQSALYYYDRVLAANPKDRMVNAEIDALLVRVAQVVSAHLANGNFEMAYQMAARVAGHLPDHRLVDEMRTSLDDYAAQLVEQAIQHARDGNDEDSTAVLELAERLPGLNPDYFVAARQSIDDLQQSRIAEEQAALEEARLASEKAISDWADAVRVAIAAGQLISPEGDSARDYLAARDAPAETKDQLTTELMEALIAAAQKHVDEGNLSDAESFLKAANDVRSNDSAMEILRVALEENLVAAEGNRILKLSNFVQMSTPPPKYPRSASRRNVTGWVELVFTVTPAGTTSEIEVLNSEPANVFEASAMDAVEKWTFQPREYRGQAISQRTAAKLVFDLE